MDLDRGILVAFGLPADPTILRETMGAPRHEALRALLVKAGRPDLLSAVVARRCDLLADRIVARVVPMRGAEAALQNIPHQTHRFALVTSNPREVAEGILERFGWRWRFDTLVTADDITRFKPDPEPYRLACERLAIDPAHTLAIEDSPAGIASARAAGCRVAAVPGTFAVPELAGAHYVLSNLETVVSLVHMLA